MNPENPVRVRLFGEFRAFCSQAEIAVVPRDARTVGDLKKAVASALEKESGRREAIASLISVSAVAGETRILFDSERLEDLGMSSFALLPPVCGG